MQCPEALCPAILMYLTISSLYVYQRMIFSRCHHVIEISLKSAFAMSKQSWLTSRTHVFVNKDSNAVATDPVRKRTPKLKEISTGNSLKGR